MPSRLTLALAVIMSVAQIRTAAATSFPPTNTELTTNFKWTSSGASSSGFLAWDFKDNVGTITNRGDTFDAVAYYTQTMGWPNPPGVVRWINILGVSPTTGNVGIAYIGCDPPPATHEVTSIWEEDMQHGLQTDAPVAHTACDFTDLTGMPQFTFNVSMPEVTQFPNTPFNSGIVIDPSEKVGLQNTTGFFVTEGGQNNTLTVITTVNCNTCGANCHNCPHSPWWEVHFFYENVEAATVGFGIFYLFPDTPSFVQLNYTLSLPALAQPDLDYEVGWSGHIPANGVLSRMDHIYTKDPHEEDI